MNQDEVEGGVRYVKGKIERNVGDVASSTSWQADGIVDQVAGGAQNLYGRAKDHVEDLIDDAPTMLHEAGERARHVARRSRDMADERMKQNPWALAAVVGVVGYAVSWLIHGRRT